MMTSTNPHTNTHVEELKRRVVTWLVKSGQKKGDPQNNYHTSRSKVFKAFLTLGHWQINLCNILSVLNWPSLRFIDFNSLIKLASTRSLSVTQDDLKTSKLFSQAMGWLLFLTWTNKALLSDAVLILYLCCLILSCSVFPVWPTYLQLHLLHGIQ